MSRLKEIREFLGLSQQKLADEINEKRYRINDMESGKTKIQVDFASLIEEKFNINPWWLLTGKGKMLLKDSIESTLVLKDSNLVEFPYFEETYAGAGGGAINYAEAKKPIAFDKTFLEKTLGIKVFKNLHIINATGNSMEPTIKEKSLLFVNPFENESCQIKDGGIYVINCNNSTFVKRINHNPITGVVKLKSDNSQYEDMIITGQEFESCVIIGRVVGHFSNF